MIGYIYGLFDPRCPIVLENCRYIGQTSTTLPIRLSWHIRATRSTSKKHTRVNRWIASLLNKGVQPLIVLLDAASIVDLDDLETWWIAYGRRQGWDLTNYQDGGKNTMLHSGARQKVSNTLSGRSLTEEHRQKIGISRRGILHTDEAKAKQSKSANKRWEASGAKEAYSELMSAVMADPEVRQRVSGAQLSRFERARDEALATHTDDTEYTFMNQTVRYIIMTRCDGLCFICNEPIDESIPYRNPDNTVNPMSFQVRVFERVPKRQPRTYGNSYAVHFGCRSDAIDVAS